MTSVQNYHYDIFLSFRGEDTRHGFTGYLYDALCQRGFKTFIDHEELQTGEEISPALIKAIEESKVSIVIFSENYASSPWCLNELVKILEYKKEKGQMVWPIFYKVEPSDVRNQRNSFKEAMDKHENRFKDENEKVKRWKSALNEAANLSGSTYRTGYEFEFITKIIEDTSTKLHRKRLYIGEHIIGLESQLENIKSLLNIQYDDTERMLGIHGIGGIGKTTLVKVLYNLIIDHFDCACFLESVQEKSNGGGVLVNVQEKLLSQIFEKINFNFGSVEEGAHMIKHRLSNRRVLLVLDDVDKKVQLEKLAGGCDWFGPGSRIIITTRDRHLLIGHGIKKIYEMKKLDYKNALELFCLKAFKKNKPHESYMDISNQIIDYAEGLPLALKVIGSNLFGRSLNAWELALDKYQRRPDKGIQDILRVSYDDLDDDQKTVFLDIACFFKGERLKYVEKILDACDLSPQSNIEVLVDRSLININKVGNLEMHDLIQDMGKEVVKQDASSKLGEYSRLWNHEDIVDVLTTNSNFENVTWMNLLDCQLLNQVPDLSRAPNITSLTLDGCNNLIEVHDFVGVHTNLKQLSLQRCTNLKIFPRGIKMRSLERLDLSGCRSLQHFPDILEEMVNLWFIDARGTGIKEIPHSICYLPMLQWLHMSHCYDLVSLPECISQLDRLEYLDVDNCKKLRQFSRVPPNLKILQLDGCMSSQSLNSILSQALQAAKPFQVSMSRIDIPDCFDHRCKGGRLSFWARVKYVHKFNFAAVFKISSKISSQSNGVMHMDIYRYNNGIETSIWGRSYFSNESGIIILWLSDYSNIKIHDWNHVEIKCRSLSPYYEIDECGVYMCKKDMNMEDIQFECPIPSNSNMDTVMSKNDEELRDLIDEAKPRKRCRRFMSSNDEKIDEAKRRKMCRRVGSRNGKQREASELPRRRFIKKRIGIHTGWRRKVLAPLLFSKLFKLSSSFHSIGKLKQLLSTDQRQCLC